MIKNEVYEKLVNSNEYISGQKIANELGVSRVAINKAIISLKEDGVVIESVTNKGYKLIGNTNNYCESVILSKLKSKDYYIKCYEEVSSTNDIVKELIKEHDKVLVISDSQSNGKGNRGRSFISQKGVGAYFTLGLKIQIPIKNLEYVTSLVSTYVSSAIDTLANCNTQIKWVNDIYLNGKKICGILSTAELNCEEGTSSYVLVGIGINVFKTTFPKELEGIASTIEYETKIKVDRQELIAKIVNKFENIQKDLDSKKYLKEYKAKSNLIGGIISIRNGEEIISGECVDIDDECRLVIKKGENTLRFRVGDVTMHL